MEIGYWLLAIGDWIWVIGYWVLAIGNWIWDIGYGLLAIGDWILAIGYGILVMGMGKICHIGSWRACGIDFELNVLQSNKLRLWQRIKIQNK